tara:strand:- start:206 stop:454 length:249 start_codon:yes stop_codon:yes gene_type:complete
MGQEGLVGLVVFAVSVDLVCFNSLNKNKNLKLPFKKTHASPSLHSSHNQNHIPEILKSFSTCFPPFRTTKPFWQPNTNFKIF